MDGQWRLALADIPSNPYRPNADQFREKVKRMGLYPLQRTVWVIRLILGRKSGLPRPTTKWKGLLLLWRLCPLDPEDLKNYKSILKKKELFNLIAYYFAILFV